MSAIAPAADLAPEIGVMGVKCWTKDEQLKHPYGVAAYVLQPVSRKVKLVFEYEHLISKKREGPRPTGESNSSVQTWERNRVSFFQIGFLHGVAHARSTFLEVGGGLCFARLTTDRRFVSIGWYSRHASKAGLVLESSLLVTELKDLPLVMRFGFKHRFLSEGEKTCYNCGGGAFRNAITTTEVSWGFGYQFGRRAAPKIGEDRIR